MDTGESSSYYGFLFVKRILIGSMFWQNTSTNSCLQGDQEAREDEEVSCEVARVEAAREAMVGQGQVFVPDCDPDTGHYRHTQVGVIMAHHVTPTLQLVL